MSDSNLWVLVASAVVGFVLTSGIYLFVMMWLWVFAIESPWWMDRCFIAVWVTISFFAIGVFES